MSIPRKGLSIKLAYFLADQSWACDTTGPSTAQLVMLRGCKVNADGSLSQYGDPRIYTDRYDDVLVVFGQKSGGQPYLEMFRATAKPGLAWIKHPTYAASNRGCPTVQPGQYQYQRGPHRNHPEAMRQVYKQPVVVIRDLDDDTKLELTDLVDYPWDTGINIHAGGRSEKVGLNSSGCQVLWGGWDGEPWLRFHKLIYSVAKKQQVFRYTLVDFAMFADWHDAGALKPRHLLFGSAGQAVRDLQKTLGDGGFFGQALIDGKFGRGTDRALRGWQRNRYEMPTGIIRRRA